MQFLLVVLATLGAYEWLNVTLPVPAWLQYPGVAVLGFGLAWIPYGPVMLGLGAAGAVLLLHTWYRSGTSPAEPTIPKRVRLP